MLTDTQIASIAGRPVNDNMRSVTTSLDRYGKALGLDRPHRLAQYIAQIGHESGRFRWDREVWNGKGAQARYDVRTDLGNTPERDGDGYTYRGRTAGQITGKDNYADFTNWARKLDRNAPDFVANPDLMNTDPWEGLGPLWYWDTRDLNAVADRGDLDRITKVWNGGYNGLSDRKAVYVRAALVLLGYAPNAVSLFQRAVGLTVDGVAGPMTREALHRALLDVRPLTAPRVSAPTSAPSYPVTTLWGRLVAALSRAFGSLSRRRP